MGDDFNMEDVEALMDSASLKRQHQAVWPSTLVDIFIPGRARPKGSMRPIPSRDRKKVAMVEDNRHSSAWRATVASALGERINFGRADGWPFLEPIIVNLVFAFDRAASNCTDVPTREVGDIDKLERNILDAMTDSGVIKDDSQVVEVTGKKLWTGIGLGTGLDEGVRVTVRPWVAATPEPWRSRGLPPW